MRLILVFCLLYFVPSVNAEIYKWVDAQGRVHYDDKPPLAGQKQLMDINEESNAVKAIPESRAEKRRKLLDAMDEDRKLKKEQEAKEKKKKAKFLKQCHVARDNLKLYQRSHSVYDLDKDGNRVTLPSSARDQVIANIKKQIKKYCK